MPCRDDIETDYQRVGQPLCGYVLPREQKDVPIIGSSDRTYKAFWSGYLAMKRTL
ncbi:UNVERIFIED_CONTAM: hypothetical protein ODX46_14185 [Salmonella enterica subsp. enterica serovar Enteritidis]